MKRFVVISRFTLFPRINLLERNLSLASFYIDFYVLIEILLPLYFTYTYSILILLLANRCCISSGDLSIKSYDV